MEFIEWAQEEVNQMMKNVNIPARYLARDSDDEDDGNDEED